MGDTSLETRILKSCREEIVRCIHEPSIVTRLSPILHHDDYTRIERLYLGDRQQATRELLNALDNCQEPGKWTAFMTSLAEEYPHLKTIIETAGSQSDTTQQRKLALFRHELSEKISFMEDETILNKLRSTRVISSTDYDEISRHFLNSGNAYAVVCMLTCMQTHLSPEEWYYHFLCALEENYRHIIEEIEPDFLTSRSAFMPKLSPIVPEDTLPLGIKGCTGEEPSKDVGEAQEHVSYAYSEPSLDVEGSLPPPVPERSDSLLETMRSLSVHDDDGSKPENNGCDSENDSETNSLDSDQGGSDVETESEEDAQRFSVTEKHQDTSQGLIGDSNNPMSGHSGHSHKHAGAEKLSLRGYQIELAQDAVFGRNTIVCAETGTGKTWVALHIIQKHLAQASQRPRKVAFMARTGVLIKQQCNRFMKHLPQFHTKLLTGEDDDSRIMDAFIPNFDILCFTPQILVNNIEKGGIKSISEFSLLVLDECHHTKGDTAYARLMRNYLVEKEQRRGDTSALPQIVGLTASIGVGKARTDEEALGHILRVCACLDTRILSTVETRKNKEELSKWITVPQEETIKMIVKRPDPCQDVIIEAMEEIDDTLQELALMQPDLIEMLDKQPRDKESQEYNKWTVDMIKAAQMNVHDEDTMRDISSCAMYLNVYNSALEVNQLLQIKDVVKYLATKHRQEAESRKKLTEDEKTLFNKMMVVQKKLNGISRAAENENPNVRLVSNQLVEMMAAKGEDSRAILFVKARETCRALAAFLDKDLKERGVSASPLYGKEARAGDEGMTESQQTEVLEKFRRGFYKIMVCTSVGTEGIDVPDCNIVINYNYSGDEITKIQMKGRSRKIDGMIKTIANEKQVEQEMLNTYKAAMMYRAMNDFKQLNPKAINYRVEMYQREEREKHRYKVVYEQAKKSRRSEDDFEIRCRRCNKLACYVSDVRCLGSQHLVLGSEFKTKITTKPHKQPKTYDGITKKAKMYCKGCPIDWGIVAERHGTDLMILKIINLKFVNMRTHDVTFYKKWIEVPYRVPEIELDDIPRLFGTDGNAQGAENDNDK